MAPTGSGSSEWSRERIEQTARSICDPSFVRALLDDQAAPETGRVRDILHRAREMKGLAAEDAAALIAVADEDLRREIQDSARRVRETAYGRRISLCAPVCPTNRCVNDCLYCPLRRSNSRVRRSAYTDRDLQREIVSLLDEGHRHLVLVFGDDRSGVPYVRDMVGAAYGVRSGLRQVQRVDINVDALRVDELRLLQQSGPLGTYHVFQETYDPQSYAALHPEGPKADYDRRLTCHDRALEAGVVDLGLGLLLGCHDWRFDVVALLQHSRYLADIYGQRAHSFTLQRMVPAPGAPASREPERRVADGDFAHIIAVVRLASPYTDIVLSTPASSEVRRLLVGVGVSRVVVGSKSYPGVYTGDGDPEAAGHLTIDRPRALERLVYRMAEVGFVPNLCAACYVQRRRAPVVEGIISPQVATDRCAPNALLALKEYVMDYASPETQTVVCRLIQGELARLPEDVRQLTLELMEEAEAGLRGQML